MLFSGILAAAEGISLSAAVAAGRSWRTDVTVVAAGCSESRDAVTTACSPSAAVDVPAVVMRRPLTSLLPLTASDAKRFCRAAAAGEAGAARCVAAVEAAAGEADAGRCVAAVEAMKTSVTVMADSVVAVRGGAGSVPVNGSSSVAGKTRTVVSVDLAGAAGAGIVGGKVVSTSGSAVVAAAVVDTGPAVVDPTRSADSSSVPPAVFFLSARLDWSRARILLLATSLDLAASSELASGAEVVAEGWARLRLRLKGAAGLREGLGAEGSEEEEVMADVWLLDSLLFELKLTLTNCSLGERKPLCELTVRTRDTPLNGSAFPSEPRRCSLILGSDSFSTGLSALRGTITF